MPIKIQCTVYPVTLIISKNMSESKMVSPAEWKSQQAVNLQ